MAKRCRHIEHLCSKMFPTPGQNIVGDWRICEINEKGAVKRIGNAYLTRDLAYDAISKMNGYYIVKFLKV